LIGGHVSEVLGDQFGVSRFVGMVWQVLDWVFFIAFVLIAFNILYIYGPAVKHRRWRWMMPGTIVAALLWLDCFIWIQALPAFHGLLRQYLRFHRSCHHPHDLVFIFSESRSLLERK
jgi:hypothetical protein